MAACGNRSLRQPEIEETGHFTPFFDGDMLYLFSMTKS